MKLLHQLGHNKKWNIDAYYENSIGDGFIYGAFNIEYNRINSLNQKDIDLSLVDLQYYGKQSSAGLGKLNSFPFHPAKKHVEGTTLTDGISNIIDGIKYQEKSGFSRILIPNYYENRNLDILVDIIESINKYVKKHKSDPIKYFLTLPISNSFIMDQDKMNRLLTILTDMHICFDGYYIVCESRPMYKQKVDINYDYLSNLTKCFKILKQQGFEIIYGYANWDAILYYSLIDLDYLTIGTYENLRSFNNVRYSEKVAGGPSDGWYFSEKLLNFVRAREITKIRRNRCLDLIKNDYNIFSDKILDVNFPWNTHKPEVHKNYLLSISNIYKELGAFTNLSERVNHLIKRIKAARKTYRKLAENNIYLTDESDDYHLGEWLAFLRSEKQAL